MPRKLFCEYGPLAYKIAAQKECIRRTLRDFARHEAFARQKNTEPLPTLLYSHKSLIRRKLGDVDMRLQENKAHNLALAAPKVNGILLRPGETFSFWTLIGRCTPRKGYREGLTIARGETRAGVGGGMCQFTNLLHWLVLHSPLEITEHHHHDGYDLFPDFGRQVPFGCGTSIFYKHMDYRVKNTTAHTFQILVWTDENYLCGELRAENDLGIRYHIKETQSRFVRLPDAIYRENTVERRTVDIVTGNETARQILRRSHAKTMYDESYIDPALIVTPE
ncbi:MAG: VanW family protein [Oscillospiraceae bacterium]|jgi:vancomycin resistance protein VanW|nr:VanW family protein [Oscillospiraceae bacterium]